MGRLLGGEHASTPQSGVEAPRLLRRSLPRLYCCCCCCVCLLLCVVVLGGEEKGVCIEHFPVCTFNTLHSKRPRVYRQNAHMYEICERFAGTRGDVLNVRTGGFQRATPNTHHTRRTHSHTQQRHHVHSHTQHNTTSHKQPNNNTHTPQQH